MVFESIVAELLNKVLGEYIENLDYSQLKLSLWGGKTSQDDSLSILIIFNIKILLLSGDVVLKDLFIKESALDVLDLPVRLEYGRLGIKILYYLQ